MSPFGSTPFDQDAFDRAILDSPLPRHIRAKLFAHRLHGGCPLAVRLNLTGGGIAYTGRTLRLLSVHAGGSPSGRVIGYDGLVTLHDARFVVQAGAWAAIASGQRHKFPMAAVAGTYQPGDVLDATWWENSVEIGFDPLRAHLFVELATGLAVRAAAAATICDNRVYASDIIYWDEAKAPSAAGLPSIARFAYPAIDLADAASEVSQNTSTPRCDGTDVTDQPTLVL